MTFKFILGFLTVLSLTASANVDEHLALKIYSVKDKSLQDEIFKETGTSVCQTSAAQSVLNCTIEVPQERLYSSALHFQLSWINSKNCNLLTFQPYYYQLSSSPSFHASPSKKPIDCSRGLYPDCYGGAAPFLIPNFPNDRRFVYVSESTTMQPSIFEEALPSAKSLNYETNRLSVNDLPLAKRGTTYSSSQMGGFGDSYAANSFVDYSFTCSNEYGDSTQSIHLFVRDKIEKRDRINTWKELP